MDAIPGWLINTCHAGTGLEAFCLHHRAYWKFMVSAASAYICVLVLTTVGCLIGCLCRASTSNSHGKWYTRMRRGLVGARVLLSLFI